jgi:predicted alpha-1,2-mannosidase
MKQIRNTIIVLMFLSVAYSPDVLSGLQKDLTKYVDPFIGTGGHGHTYPGASLPFGMVQLSPDTRVEGWDACGGYYYSDSTLFGFSHTHLSGTGVADYGDILVTPSVGLRRNRALKFSHSNEQATPGYYRVYLPGDKINAELTATERVGVHRYTFPSTDSAIITFNLHHGLGPDSVTSSSIEIVNDHEIRGFRRSSGWAKDQLIFFDAQFSRPFNAFVMIVDDTSLRNEKKILGTNLKASFRFPAKMLPPVMVKVGLSSVSVDGAKNNLSSEVPGWNFDAIRKRARDEWNKDLGKIDITGGDKNRMVIFYTALYHALLTPNIQSDVDGRYRGMDGAIHTAKFFSMYTVFSLWDTFRAEHPLLTIIDPKRDQDLVNSLLAKYDESGILPVWELASNETWTMIGYHAVPVIVDAFMKGIRGFDAEKSFRAMKHSAMMDQYGLRYYRQYGYIPGDLDGESVSKTLEYAYDDWCIAQMARALDHPDDYASYLRRAQNYQNVFDPSTGFMRAKENGCWTKPFDPVSVTVHYTEANAWQYSFFVPHDIEKLIEDIGGNTKFTIKLDSLFYSIAGLSGRHQADISGLIGQYAQGNEPSHHVAYLYDYAGKPWKTADIVATIMDSLYTLGPDGLCGNDDCGQMSAWYVMSALGFYQVCPGKPEYSIGRPIFPKAIIHTGTEKSFTIEIKKGIGKPKYIVSATMNGKVYDKSYFTHRQLTDGGTLKFTMGNSPSDVWGIKPGDIPSTSIPDRIVPVPFFVATGKTFADTEMISISSPVPVARIYYTIDSATPSLQSKLYEDPFLLRETKTVKAIAMTENGTTSDIAEAIFYKRSPVGKITLLTKYDQQYTGGGDDALIDGLKGGLDFRLGAWQGYEQSDVEAIVDLQKTDSITMVSLGCLQDVNSWIFFPKYVEYSFSMDGNVFKDTIRLLNDVSLHDETVQIQRFKRLLPPVQARYIRLKAGNVGICPAWHRGAGGKAWLFVDELEIETK